MDSADLTFPQEALSLTALDPEEFISHLDPIWVLQRSSVVLRWSVFWYTLW